MENHRRFCCLHLDGDGVLRGYARPAFCPACYQYPNLLNKPSSLLREIKNHNNCGTTAESVQTLHGPQLLERKMFQNTSIALNVHVALHSEIARSSRGANKRPHRHACHTATHSCIKMPEKPLLYLLFFFTFHHMFHKTVFAHVTSEVTWASKLWMDGFFFSGMS